MANTYSQHFFHVVFAVRHRESLIHQEIKEDLYKYMSGIITNQNQKLFIINGVPDHVHLLLNCKPDINLSSLIREVKEHSSKFINSTGLLRGKFYWQSGFGSFTISKRELPNIINYIKNQEKHHRSKSFREEYLELLNEYDIEFREEYLFEFMS
ncbi:MAG: IS200/IS605 family transposase [Bacteroidota bacterium]